MRLLRWMKNSVIKSQLITSSCDSAWNRQQCLWQLKAKMINHGWQCLLITVDLLKFYYFFSLQILFGNIGTIVICCDRTPVEEVQDLLRSLKFLTTDWFPSKGCLNCSKAVTGDKKTFVSNIVFGSLEITTLKEASIDCRWPFLYLCIS